MLVTIGLLFVVIMFSYNSWLGMCGVCLMLISLLVFAEISGKAKKEIDSKDMETLVFGTDLCIGTEVIPETLDEPSYEYFILVNGGRVQENSGSLYGFPSSAKPREEFIVVSLERDPKVRMYYSRDNWFLEEDQEKASC